MSFANAVNKLIKDAPAVSSSVPVNFGPLKVTPLVVRFAGAGQRPEKITLQDYMEQNELGEEDEIELSDRETFQLRFTIGVNVLNPALDFEYEREVAVLAGNGKVKTDWEEIVLPSLVRLFGKDWNTKLIPASGKKAKVYYVAAENVDSLRPVKPQTDGTPGKNYGVPKFIALYEDLDECREARDKRYPPREDTEAMAFGPDDEAGEEEGEFTADQLERALTVFNSTKKNRKQTVKMLEKMFAKVEDHEALLDAALASEEE